MKTDGTLWKEDENRKNVENNEHDEYVDKEEPHEKSG